MKPIDLYHRLPVSLQSLALSLYGLRLRQLRYGPGHEKRVASLVAAARLTPDEVVGKQRSALARTLRHAAASVPYYRARVGPLADFSQDEAEQALEEWPILRKADVQEHSVDLLRTGASTRQLASVSTGGTTGTPLTIYASRETLRANFAFFERQKRWAGVGPEARIATFAGRPIVPPDQTGPPYSRRNYAAHQLLCSSYHLGPTSARHYMAELEQFGPELIDSYPSNLEVLAREAHATLRRWRPKAILTSSETLFPETRRRIESAFGSRVFDQYGSAEMVAFVGQCELGGYHISTEYGYIEILDEHDRRCPPGVTGRIVATGFLNQHMPLIRYDTGDAAAISPSTCACGRGLPLLKGIQGRIDDYVVTPDGRHVGRLDPIFKGDFPMVETRIVQPSTTEIRVEYVAPEDLTPGQIQQLSRELRLRLGSAMGLHFTRVQRLPRTGSGKLRTVIREFD